MLYRLAVIGIVAFWLVMMGLLVRLETHPEATSILDVPVSYVARIMFRHGQQSLLTVRQGDEPVGTVLLRPSMTGSNGRVLDFSGTLAVQLPMAARQRISFDGTINMDVALQVTDFRWELAVREPQFHLAVNGDVPRKTIHCEVTRDGQMIASREMPMTAAGIGSALLQNSGMDAHALPAGLGAESEASVTARETQIALHGEELAVYEVAVREGDATPVIDLFVTQLGQVVLAKTNFGYTLAGEGFQ